jgi:RsiW-degrading membrane proteinase PrsW (M82 family)
MSDIQIAYNGQVYTFAPGATIRIGRSSDNDVVVNDPTVSRRHAQVSWESSGWVWRNAGQAPTFLAGQPVAQFGVGQVVDVCLASPQGPALRLQAAAGQGQPMKTELAGVGGAPAMNLPGQAPPAQGFAAAAPGFAQEGGPAQGGPAQGGPAQGGPAQGGPGQSGYPPGGGAPVAPPGYGPGYGPGAAPPGMPGYPGAPMVPAAGIPLSQLDQGSFFETLIPIKSWIHDRGWRQGIRLLIIPYALLPLIFLQVFSTSTSLSSPGWAYSLYVAPLWLLTFWYLIRPPVIGRFEVFVAIGIIIWTIIWLHVVTIYINDNFANTHNILGSLVVGYNEETTKALPVLIAAIIVLKAFHRKLDPRTWFLMGTVAGLTFGIVEQSIYTPLAIVQIHSAHAISQADSGALSFAFRVFVDGFQHAVWAGVSGFFVGMAVNYRRRRIPLLLLGVSIPAVLHALNDYTLTIFSTVWAGVLIQAFSLLLFLGYTLSASSIERRVRRNPNFRGQSIMMERFSQPEQAAQPGQG